MAELLNYDLVLLLSGLGLAGISVYLFSSAILTNNTDAEALAWASGDEPNKSKSPVINFSRPLVHNFTLQHAARVKSERYRKSVEKKLMTAGLSEELNVDEFIGLQILWGLMFPLLLVILNFALRLDYPYPMCFILGAVGIMFPHMYADGTKKSRYASVIADLPFFIDLMALSTAAGSEFTNAIQKITEKAEDSVLADELGQVLNDIRLGSARADALRALSDRLDIPEITSFVAVIIDATQTGTEISKVLKDQSAQMRLERFTRAEKAGAKASQLILLPMMLCILPAVFILVFAPVVIQFFNGGG